MERRRVDADGRVWYWDQDTKPGDPPCKVYVVQVNELTVMSKLAHITTHSPGEGEGGEGVEGDG